MAPVASNARHCDLAGSSHGARTDQMTIAAASVAKDHAHHGMTMTTGREPADKAPA
jgi:hypothetical protein